MKPTTNNEQMEAYSEAVKSGLYAKKSGLVGKYDNVRRYWEEEITRHFIYPPLLKLTERLQALMHRIRILDLGCGSADGYELLAGIRRRDANLQDFEVDLLTPDILGLYTGVDLNDDLLEQAREIYGDNPKMIFEQADFTQGLPLSDNEKPYDLYFTSYGTCSHHNEDETLIRLLADIAKRTEEYCIIICDWLGRYSYEWQTLWTNDLKENRNMDYVVSYIYEEEEREERRDELQHLFLRLMSRQEAEAIIAAASKQAGVEIKPLVFFDRSIFTGRHMDTAEYNPHVQSIRQAINSLHEPNQRTDLGTLIINYVPKAGFEFINDYFEHLQMCWNTLVQYVGYLLISYDEAQQSFRTGPPPIPASYPSALREMMARMQRVVEGVGWLGIGLPRENVIEPQLGYALRYLVTEMQQGQGCAHGLVGVFEVEKISL
jgi:SAM-dependent methyltransferase